MEGSHSVAGEDVVESATETEIPPLSTTHPIVSTQLVVIPVPHVVPAPVFDAGISAEKEKQRLRQEALAAALDAGKAQKIAKKKGDSPDDKRKTDKQQSPPLSSVSAVVKHPVSPDLVDKFKQSSIHSPVSRGGVDSTVAVSSSQSASDVLRDRYLQKKRQQDELGQVAENPRDLSRGYSAQPTNDVSMREKLLKLEQDQLQRRRANYFSKPHFANSSNNADAKLSPSDRMLLTHYQRTHQEGHVLQDPEIVTLITLLVNSGLGEKFTMHAGEYRLCFVLFIVIVQFN
jgi:hypothetical protein